MATELRDPRLMGITARVIGSLHGGLGPGLSGSSKHISARDFVSLCPGFMTSTIDLMSC